MLMYVAIIAGAVAIMLIGRSWKGRDFLGLAITLAIAVSAALSFFLTATFDEAVRDAARGGGSLQSARMAVTIINSLIGFGSTFVLGLIFVAASSSNE